MPLLITMIHLKQIRFEFSIEYFFAKHFTGHLEMEVAESFGIDLKNPMHRVTIGVAHLSDLPAK